MTAIRAHFRQWLAHGAPIAVIVGLLFFGTTIVYATGGTSYAFPYVQLVPVLVAAAVYQTPGGIFVGIIAAFLLGPFMPLDVDRGIDQSTTNWLTRMTFYAMLGGLTGWLFARVRNQDRERDRLAREDRATGLPNRAALEEAIDDAVRRNSIPGNQMPVLFIVRITDFFEAMDALGADSGDDLALGTARLIESAGLDVGRGYRFSATEVAFLAEPDNTKQLASWAATIKAAGENPIDARGAPIRVELCVGADAARASDIGRAFDLVRRAQLALSAAEERNQDYALYEPALERSTRETFELITRLRRALDEDQFELFYLPKLRLSDGVVVGVEALIRWRDPSRGLVSPGQFISKVERTSLIGPVTRFACHEACLFAAQHPDLAVSYNLSPRNLYDDALLDELCEMIEHFDVSPSRMEIEVTERTFAHDPDGAAKRLQRLRNYGVPISIDDFGTGYSSFSYLHKLPITGLKIDRSFITELAQDRWAESLVRCIANVGNELELEVTAEGVETVEQLNALRRTGCRLAQGFYFSPPLSAPDLEDWLARQPLATESTGMPPG